MILVTFRFLITLSENTDVGVGGVAAMDGVAAAVVGVEDGLVMVVVVVVTAVDELWGGVVVVVVVVVVVAVIWDNICC